MFWGLSPKPTHPTRALGWKLWIWREVTLKWPPPTRQPPGGLWMLHAALRSTPAIPPSTLPRVHVRGLRVRVFFPEPGGRSGLILPCAGLSLGLSRLAGQLCAPAGPWLRLWSESSPLHCLVTPEPGAWGMGPVSAPQAQSSHWVLGPSPVPPAGVGNVLFLPSPCTVLFLFTVTGWAQEVERGAGACGRNPGRKT